MKLKNNFSSYIAIATSITTFVTLAIAFMTPPLSGPFCKASCFQYPFTDIISRFPRDYYWMFLAMILIVLYVILMSCIQQRTKDDKKIFGQIAVSFSVISATLLLACYFIQLSVVQSSLVNGETQGIALLTQFNPHGIFIALEEIGFTVMSISFLFAALTFSKENKLEKIIRKVLLTGFTLTALSLVLTVTLLGLQKEYIYEIASISFTWITLIVSGAFLFSLFRKDDSKSG